MDYGNGRSKPDFCSVLMEKSERWEEIDLGDVIWWQGGTIYWSPQVLQDGKETKCGVDFDIKFKKVGGSGVSYQTACENAKC